MKPVSLMSYSRFLILYQRLILLIIILGLISAFFSACSTQSGLSETSPPTLTTIAQPSFISSPSPKLVPSQTIAPASLPNRTSIQTKPEIQPVQKSLPVLCSPIAEIPIEDMPDLISNPYNPPPPGSDAPHQGIDFAILRPGTGMAISGAEVQAVIEGRVAGVTSQRFPYGNSILVETPVVLLPDSWSAGLDFPDIQTTTTANPALTCPEAGLQPTWDLSSHSIYILYAHLLEPPLLEIGDTIACGDMLGQIGESGNALHPHLHLEIRLGPGGATFPSMAHYDNSASQLEMQAYCLWRVSGLFQVIDPDRFLELEP